MDIISTGPAGKKYFLVARGIRFETCSDDIALLLLNNEASANGAYSYLLVSKNSLSSFKILRLFLISSGGRLSSGSMLDE